MSQALPEPPITEAMREQARRQPNTYLYVVDPEFDPTGQVPPWGIRGGFRVDANGHIDGYRANPNFRPGPRTLGLPVPNNDLERALERAATGYGENAELLAVLAEPGAQLHVLTDVNDPNKIVVATDEQQCPVLVAYTSPDRQDAPTRAVPVRALRPPLAMPQARLRLNPGLSPSVVLPGQAVVEALALVAGGEGSADV